MIGRPAVRLADRYATAAIRRMLSNATARTVSADKLKES